jgi:hypothetical protein
LSKQEIFTPVIFGRHLKISLPSPMPAYYHTLVEELEIYNSQVVQDYDVEVYFTEESRLSPALTINPKTHQETENGFKFLSRIGWTEFRFEAGSLKQIWIAPQFPKPGWSREWDRWRSIQYTTPDQEFGQCFHELVLAPMAMLHSDSLLLHASATFRPSTRRCILVGGTGGVGKTTAILNLCRNNKDFVFMADDISVLSASQRAVWPHLAYPKIYAYNLGSDVFADHLLTKGLLDRIQWTLKVKAGGLANARRRLNPKLVYQVDNQVSPTLTDYVLLSRHAHNEFRVASLNPAQAVDLSLDIMRIEMQAFANHLIWHEYNSKLLGREPKLSLASVFQRWQEQLTRVFQAVGLWSVSIPISAPHQQAADYISKYLSDLSTDEID